jgi:hypothetical protein
MKKNDPITGEEAGTRRWMRPALRIMGQCSLLAALASCASHQKDSKSDYSDLKLGQRIVKQTKDPYAIKSPFQTEVYNATRAVKTSGFKTSEYHGKKGFSSGKDDYKAGTFSQADKTNQAGSQKYNGANSENRWGSNAYKTTESGYTGKVNRNGSQVSPLGDTKFNTKGNPEALRNTSNVKRPLIQAGDGYSEDDVKKLLNKG